MDESNSLLGTLFAGRFRIESLLGTGGMGSVYLATHEVLQRKFAIKVLRRNLVEDDNIAGRFRREARAASRIEHPHITSVFDFGHTEDSGPYIAMEYVDGPTISDDLDQDGAFKVPRGLRIMAQVADALAAAHAGQVVHRDLKPKNIVLTTHRGQADYVKILDFGLAKILGMASTKRLTMDGEAIGTPIYMSPEQCAAQAVDHRTDIYSFGILAFEMLVGRVPFAGKVMTQVIGAHLHKEPPVPSETAESDQIPANLDSLILRCLAKQPDERFQSASELHQEILSVQESIGEMPATSRRQVEVPAHWPISDPALAPTIPPEEPLPPTADAPESDLTPQEWEMESPEDKRENTDLEWPVLHDSVNLRSRALEELAFAVRDRGIGSAEISHVLSLKMETEDRIYNLQSDIALIEASSVELEIKAGERESRLRQALNQLEHERSMLTPEEKWPDRVQTIPWGSSEKQPESMQEGKTKESQRLNARALELARKIQQVSQQLEEDLAALQKKREDKQIELQRLFQELNRHEDQLANLLWKTRPQVLELSEQGLTRLLSLAGIQ
jgi:serine/threonine protein kinase